MHVGVLSEGSMRAERDVCGQCGARGVRPASLRDRARRWFVYGGGMARAYVCESCGAAWSGGVGWKYLSRSSGWRRWSGMPAAIIAALRRERTWHPVPRFYATVGTASGVPVAMVVAIMRQRRGWWWPLAAAGAAIGGVFTLSLVSALRGGRAHEAITRVVAPERAAAAKLERDVQGIRRGLAGHGLLVPVNWDGPVVLSGMQWRGLSPRDRRLTSLSVAALERDSPGAEPRIKIVHDLEGVPAPLVEQRAEREVDSRDWQDGIIIVDGQRREVRAVEGDGLLAATLRHNGRPVMVIAMNRDLSTLELATTSSVEPLLDEMMRRHSLRMGSSGESTSTSNR